MDDFTEFQDRWIAADAATRAAELEAGEALRNFRRSPNASNLGRLTDSLAARAQARSRVRALMGEFSDSQQEGVCDICHSGTAGHCPA